MASVYDENFLTDEQKRQINSFQAEWERANAAGDRAGMDAAHAAAERVRAQAGYSGGENGGGYTALPEQSQRETYTAQRLSSYEPQVDRVNEVYDAARDAQLAQLKSAYEQNNATLEAQRAQIPVEYQNQRNATAASSELTGRNFREYAAASGLNSGTGGQAELARSNQLQGDLSAIGQQETAEKRELESKIAQLKIQYQNAVSEAIAQGEYDRAAALLQEYQRAAESQVTTSQAQADENFRAWQSGYQQRQDALSQQNLQSELEYQRQQDAQSQQNWQAQFDYGREQDAQAQQNWQAQFDYGKGQDAQSQQNWQAQFDYERRQDDIAGQYSDWEQRLKEAEFYAGYGDFSKLRALGVDTTAYERAYAASLAGGGSGSGSGGSSGGRSGTSGSGGSTAIPALGTDGWYDYIIAESTATGQSAEDYLRAHRSELGLTASDVKTYAERIGKYQESQGTAGSGTSGDTGGSNLGGSLPDNYLANLNAAFSSKGITDESQLGTTAKGMLGQMRSHPVDRDTFADQIGIAVENGYMTPAEGDYLLDILGVGR